MIEECARPGSELQKTNSADLVTAFHSTSAPSYIPKDVFMAKIKEAIEKRFHDTVASSGKLRSPRR
jgi:hypothetical protein